VEQKALNLLSRHRYMAVATVRPDGWPQATIVAYANDGLLLYFLISRASQKFANIRADDRVSVAIGHPGGETFKLEGLSIAAHASEVTDPVQRSDAWARLRAEHKSFAGLAQPDYQRAAMMRARCSIITISDYHAGLGHADVITIGTGGFVEMAPRRADDWGITPAAPGSR
jgi:general stress protein 26